MSNQLVCSSKRKQRRKVLAQINNLSDEKCKKCSIFKSAEERRRNIKYCNTKCDVGKELQSLGSQLQRGKPVEKGGCSSEK